MLPLLFLRHSALRQLAPRAVSCLTPALSCPRHSQFDGISGVTPVVELMDGTKVELDMQDTLETWFKPVHVQ